MHVTDLTWIVVEDDRKVTNRLKNILQKFPSLNIVLMAGRPSVFTSSLLHLLYIDLAPMPQKFKLGKGPKPRGVAARNAAIRWIVDNAKDEGVMYFADDDNTYDLRLFHEVRK